VYHLGSASLLQSELGHVSGVTMMGFALSVHRSRHGWAMHASHVAGNVSLTVPVPELPLCIPWQKVVRWFMQMSSCLHQA
jgi:hypothetical protein